MPAAGQLQSFIIWLLFWIERKDLAQEKAQLDIALLLSGHTMYPSHHEQPGWTASSKRPGYKGRCLKVEGQSLSSPLSSPSIAPHSRRSGLGDEGDGVRVVRVLQLSSCWMKVTHCCESNRSQMVGSWWQRLINVNYNGK